VCLDAAIDDVGADTTRTVVVGKKSELMRMMLAAVEGAIKAGVAVMGRDE
jgi:Xaa-Pro aminopeptidase